MMMAKIEKICYARGSSNYSGYHYVFCPSWIQPGRSEDSNTLDSYCFALINTDGLEKNDNGQSAFFFYSGREGGYLFRCFLHSQGGRGTLSLEGVASQDTLELFKEAPSIITALREKQSELDNMAPSIRDVIKPVVQEVDPALFSRFGDISPNPSRFKGAVKALFDDIRNARQPFSFLLGAGLLSMDEGTRVYDETPPPPLQAPTKAVLPLSLSDKLKALFSERRWSPEDIREGMTVWADFVAMELKNLAQEKEMAGLMTTIKSKDLNANTQGEPRGCQNGPVKKLLGMVRGEGWARP